MRIMKNLESRSITTNSCEAITFHKTKLQTREVHHSIAYDHIYHVLARQLIPTQGSRAIHEKPVGPHKFVWMRRWANTILTGIILRQYRDLALRVTLHVSFTWRVQKLYFNMFSHCWELEFSFRTFDLQSLRLKIYSSELSAGHIILACVITLRQSILYRYMQGWVVFDDADTGRTCVAGVLLFKPAILIFSKTERWTSSEGLIRDTGFISWN